MVANGTRIESAQNHHGSCHRSEAPSTDRRFPSHWPQRRGSLYSSRRREATRPCRRRPPSVRPISSRLDPLRERRTFGLANGGQRGRPGGRTEHLCRAGTSTDRESGFAFRRRFGAKNHSRIPCAMVSTFSRQAHGSERTSSRATLGVTAASPAAPAVDRRGRRRRGWNGLRPEGRRRGRLRSGGRS